MPLKSLNFVMVPDEKEGDLVSVPLKKDTNGKIRPELPEIASEFLKAKPGRDSANIHGEHE